MEWSDLSSHLKFPMRKLRLREKDRRCLRSGKWWSWQTVLETVDGLGQGKEKVTLGGKHPSGTYVGDGLEGNGKPKRRLIQWSKQKQTRFELGLELSGYR